MLLPGIGWPGGSPENSAIILGVIAGAYFGAIWLAALIWTARDIRERSPDLVTQAVATLIVLVFNLPGWVLYRVLRPPLTQAEVYERQLEEEALLQDLTHQLACPHCGAEVKEDYVACPHCTTKLRQPCDECGRALALGWHACPWCGTERKAAAPAAEAAQPEAAPEPVPTPAPRAVRTTAANAGSAGAPPVAAQSPFQRRGRTQAPASAPAQPAPVVAGGE